MKFEKPELEVITFEMADIVTASGGVTVVPGVTDEIPGEDVGDGWE